MVKAYRCRRRDAASERSPAPGGDGTSIARSMTRIQRGEEGTRGSCRAARSSPSRSRGRRRAIDRVLKSPIYAGFTTHGDDMHPGEHPPLIEESTYRAAQAILAGTRRVVRWSGTNPNYVLRRLVRCGLCGEMICPGSTTKPSTGKTHRYYRCSRREKHGKDQGAGRPLPAAVLEEFVVAASQARPPTARWPSVSRSTSRPSPPARARSSASCARSWRRRSPSLRRPLSRLTEELVRLDGHARELVG
jgi:hypothetical protein